MRLARAPSAQVQGPCPLNLTHRRQRRRIGPQQQPGERGSKHIVVLQRGIDSGVGWGHAPGLAYRTRQGLSAWVLEHATDAATLFELPEASGRAADLPAMDQPAFL
ncbi:Uncharacterised protein [Pseudomonas putida]|nr:Uncharacterised protein [Pseudomonas putida]